MDRKNISRIAVLRGAAAVTLLGFAGNACADRYGLQLTAGAGTHNVDKADIGLMWDPDITWWKTGDWHFSLVGEGHLSYWNTSGENNRSIYGIGLTPIVRFIKASGTVQPYVEAGVGVWLLSHSTISDTFTMSTQFQFGEVIGIGARFGNRQQYQAGLRFQHLSNADIKKPNPGINFSQIYFQYNF